MKTRDELGIFWSTGGGHAEVPGVCFTGFFDGKSLPTDLPTIQGMWKQIPSAINVENIEAEDGNFIVISVWVEEWPSDELWHQVVKGTLAELVGKGALVAWCGGELCSWSLAELDPSMSSGCVYAAYTQDLELIIHSKLSDEVEYLADDELQALRAAAYKT